MSMPRRSIFCERAIQHYRWGRDKDVLPRFAAPPVSLGLWIVLGLCLLAGWATWIIQLPIQAAAFGLVGECKHMGHVWAMAFQ